MSYKFSEHVEKKFQWLVTRYPKKQAVLLPLLREVQMETGWLKPEVIDYVAERMEISSARVREVASFYTMFQLEPTGKYVINVCKTLSCKMAGADGIISKIEKTLGIKEGQTTPDGKFTLKGAECLASCHTAPCMQVNEWDYHELLDDDKIEKILNALKSDQWAHADYEKRLQDGSVA